MAKMPAAAAAAPTSKALKETRKTSEEVEEYIWTFLCKGNKLLGSKLGMNVFHRRRLPLIVVP